MNREEFLEEYTKVYRDMYRYALYVLGHREDAQDVTADAVADAFRQRDSLRERKNFRGWIFVILANKCRQMKKSYLQRTVEWTEEAPPGNHREGGEMPSGGGVWNETTVGVGAASLDVADSLAVRQSFLRLPEEEQIILAMHLFGGFTSKEIGAYLGCKAATVRSREHRALKRMRQELEER